ncbi:hypothetical protein NC651_013106 [Populus alba x Populus x berolinensis]|nr:hypothetical protein NC651_013106 [Populus alba x Populus x berolinensis]
MAPNHLFDTNLQQENKCNRKCLSGTELYRERNVKALAQDVPVPLLVLDSGVLGHYMIVQNLWRMVFPEGEVEDESKMTQSMKRSGQAVLRLNHDFSDDYAVEVEATAEASLKKLLPFSLRKSWENVTSSSKVSKNEAEDTSEGPSKRPLNKGFGRNINYNQTFRVHALSYFLRLMTLAGRKLLIRERYVFQAFIKQWFNVWE